MNRKEFLEKTSLASASLLLLNSCDFKSTKNNTIPKIKTAVNIKSPKVDEDIFSYINREKGEFNITLYRQILGAANAYKEGDETIKVAALNENSRKNARQLLANSKIKDLVQNSVFTDELQELIQKTTFQEIEFFNWSMQELKAFCLQKPESEIKKILPNLSSDVIACLVKLMSNEELIAISQKIFNPLPNSKIGSRGYMGARVQPNSPTDNTDDIAWQVFNAWSYAVGDVVLGTNPVSSEPESVARIEKTLLDIIQTFDLEDTIPNCVLSHVDIQAQVEQENPDTTGIWFQSIAGTVNANKTFDVSIEKMLEYASTRNGQYGFYAETGQGADLTNGHSEGFDMVMHESRKYGFLRALKQKINEVKGGNESWVHVNDVAGFIGPEVFKSKEQLVRCCLEDTVMGKLHGLTIGLDICSTLHMNVNLEDLDWCIEQVMPANPAYLMALPTKNDPMLSYLTTAFSNHVKIREQFGYKVNDAMWNFFKKIKIIDKKGKPTKHFGDPNWVFYQYKKAKKDKRSKTEIYKEGETILSQIEKRGISIAKGYGENIWDLDPNLNKEVHRLYNDAKVSLWTEINPNFKNSIPSAIAISTQSKDRKDYVYHPESGEILGDDATKMIKNIRASWNGKTPDIQIIISDGLNARALMDDGHLHPFLNELNKQLKTSNYTISNSSIFINNGRVRAGYACGELLFGEKTNYPKSHGIIHIIGERPGSGHHNFSAYLSVTKSTTWYHKGVVDHNISRVVSGISDTALHPKDAALTTSKILSELFLNTTDEKLIS
ncbi:ethanolamine ammonia-lyase subunit EutB [Polaribacter vadi]|uniref:ethanolamine ammonia-lyase subunit EutB n=1 Tax=Polaribacter TaxID=52959 RepID=UPI001C0A0FD7|nr:MULTISPECIES: ethanolamine ammonia-lyase subunit EutB [Polaribacter]MBU3011702.1 ethanolamine ammonia-lyase subunit EutB [Polaribacter vadi]MDO6741515.1 ethanolamine ammonia-lyase subunit EutB [Polaribacter sp. 1_MG-2023]